jgi:hypothetical protein
MEPEPYPFEKLASAYTATFTLSFTSRVRPETDIAGLWDGAVNAFGRVDIWVNNGGKSNDQTPFHELDPAVFIRIIDTNVKGVMLATHIAYNRMLKQGFGALYNMEGLGSDGRRITGLTPYGTSSSGSVRQLSGWLPIALKFGLLRSYHQLAPGHYIHFVNKKIGLKATKPVFTCEDRKLILPQGCTGCWKKLMVPGG